MRGRECDSKDGVRCFFKEWDKEGEGFGALPAAMDKDDRWTRGWLLRGWRIRLTASGIGAGFAETECRHLSDKGEDERQMFFSKNKPQTEGDTY